MAHVNGTTNGHHLPGMKPLSTFSVVELADPRTKALAECLQENHDRFAALREPQLWFHNHMPHILGSSYYMGASPEKLVEIKNFEGETLKPIDSVQACEELTSDTWRKHLADKPFTVSFTRYWDNEIEANKGDWKAVVQKALYEGKTPLINGFCGGLGHPFIHLAYAYEFDSKLVASEALSLGCTEYDMMHGYLDSPPPDTSTYKTKSLKEVVSRVFEDTRFEGHFDGVPGFLNTFTVHQTCEAALLEHWNAWQLDDDDFVAQFEEAFDTSVLLAVATGDRATQFDFFLIHLLTVAHALRIIIPHTPEDQKRPMFRQYVLWVLLMYVAQLKRPVTPSVIDNVDLQGRDWSWVTTKSLTGKWSNDSHYVKVIRALKVGAELYGDKGEFYLKAAVHFIANFDEWTGFGNGVGEH